MGLGSPGTEVCTKPAGEKSLQVNRPGMKCPDVKTSGTWR